MKNLFPEEIVKELDRYVIGQDKAKKSVSIALRNRYRRRLLDLEMQEEVRPKNILMVGPTGVGKTEIARRLAKLVNSPFVKVEATKFTEVGYVGRDVESMIRDLVQNSINMVKEEHMEATEIETLNRSYKKIAEIMLGGNVVKKNKDVVNPFEMLFNNEANDKDEVEENSIDKTQRDVLIEQIKSGKFDEQKIEIEVEENHTPSIEIIGGFSMEEMNMNIMDMLGGMMPRKTKKRKVTIKEAIRIISTQEAQQMIDMDEIISEGIKRAESDGIIFIDEIDKIANKGKNQGNDVSREGVQRDILPIIEGCNVSTKYGNIRTDHILFITAGAFHVSKVTDLIPEIQGRLPIRVQLDDLSKNDFIKILTKPENALIKQYKALLKTEGVKLMFDQTAIEEIAEAAFSMNEKMENIGARRLYTIMEELLEQISYEAHNYNGKTVRITKKKVKDVFGNRMKTKDMSNYII
jgi:ATP-dependent HslUV protease ATP-binding subunit HslU